MRLIAEQMKNQASKRSFGSNRKHLEHIKITVPSEIEVQMYVKVEQELYIV